VAGELGVFGELFLGKLAKAPGKPKYNIFGGFLVAFPDCDLRGNNF
jgi:hypothetical protein